ncbi:Lipopolysaccharide export system permease protein LptF [Phytobacter ursingii]|uniref:Lipopolysaccharide export system permease protein LptF n=1 Tax=Phytobacter ursingii TaxID=1972431 RepID=A0AB35RHD3_9ENTR|nr:MULTISPECIES: LPS export ABC transporter permease LptF [Enterobacteriaceae]MDV2860963.1 LPS export ABC transporter permease LptF [Phytobacter ursingii]GJL34691.1 LPS export ABC transporter permease LptF [Enterobacter hormaechei]VTP15876.1 Lipopolysaccharide export system permease protein LptF [Phytobacter ursingii]
MIIIRYLARETLKSQFAILFILLLIFFCQKLVRILGAAVDGEIPTNLVFSLLGLGVPEMAQLILPLSLFLGLLMTLGKLYTESEITVMHACGLSRAVLVKAAMILALFTGALAAANVMWLSPWSSRHQESVLADAKANPGMAALAQGQFQPASDGNSVLFIESVEGSKFHDVFLAQIRTKGNARPSVVVADSGHLSQLKDGSQIVTLTTGTRFEGTALLRDFRITDFKDYQAIIGHQAVTLDPDDTEQMGFDTLWKTDNPRARAELHWRLTLIFTVFMMALMVVPLSVVNPRQGRVLSMLPAMLLYLVFFLLQTSLRSNAAKGKIDPFIWMWAVNLAYLALAMGLNLWDTVPMRRIRARVMGRGAV